MSFTAVATHNRQRFVEALLPGSVALITAPETSTPYSESAPQSQAVSDNYWLTGLVSSPSSLLLFPDHPEEALREVLFVQKYDKPDAGPGLTPEEAAACTGIATVYWHTELESVFSKMAPLAKHIYLNTRESVRPENADLVQHGPFVWWCLRTFPLHSYQRAAPILAQLRQVKSPAELALLRTAARFSEAGFQRVLAYLHPGATARQLQAELLHDYLQHEGADWAGDTRLVAVGGRLRYRGGYEKSQPGDLVLLTTAASYQQYCAAFTRTLPISGQFTPRQQEVYAAVLRVFQGLRLHIRAGQTPHEIQDYGNGLLIQELLALGLFTLQELDQQGAAGYLQQYSRLHFATAPGSETEDAHNQYAQLPAGAVVPCELGIRVPAEGLDLRIGSTLVIEEGPVEDLTATIPAEPTEWEALLKGLEPPIAAAQGVSVATSPEVLAAAEVPAGSRPLAMGRRGADRPRASFWQHAHWLLLLPLLLDLGYSYVQHLNLPHDGDMVSILIPRAGYQMVLDNPLALPALLKGERYANPNRYFAHQAMFTYMRNMPLLLQSGVDAIYSVYMANAIAKVFFQALLIVLLAYYASERIAAKSKYFLIAALIITPFFQTAGYNDQMGIIDRSITYTFFYAFPLGLLLLYFLPIYKQLFSRNKKQISRLWHFVLPVLSIVLALNGPLMPAVAGLMSAGVLLYCIRHYIKSRPYITLGQQLQLAYVALPKGVFFQLVFLALCCAYSLYIGTFNAENVDTFKLGELYSKLFDGLWYELGQHAGFPVLLLSVLINLIILNKLPKDDSQRKVVTTIKWLLILSVIYIALLPFGGYRSYRPFIIRRDTIMPVTLALVYLFGTSSLYLLFNKKYAYRGVYLLGIIGIIAFYSLNDLSNLREDNREVAAQRIIASSPDKIVHLEDDCSIMNWGTITDYNYSVEQAKMMKFWNITKEEKLFYH